MVCLGVVGESSSFVPLLELGPTSSAHALLGGLPSPPGEGGQHGTACRAAACAPPACTHAMEGIVSSFE